MGLRVVGVETFYEVEWNQDDASSNGHSVYTASKNANLNAASAAAKKLVPNSFEQHGCGKRVPRF